MSLLWGKELGGGRQRSSSVEKGMMLSRGEWVFTKWSLQGKAGQAEGEREARRLTGKWSGGGGWLMGEEGE